MIKWGLNNLGFIVVKNRFLANLLFKKAFGLGLILLLTLLPLLNVEAAPNYQINYQGKLHDSAGDAVADGDYDIVFNLYTASSGGTAIWTESHTGANDIAVTDGLFSVMLGSITSIASVNFNQTLYLGVTVEADSEMTPRKVLGTVPSAFEADKLDGLTSADFISTSTTALPNVWSASGLGSVGSSTATTTFLGNLAAAGSSIFNGILTVFVRVTSPYFVATSTSVASVFPYASTTMITATTASTTNLIISGLGSGLTKVTNGVVSLASAGTDYLTSAFQNWQISGGYLTPTTTQTVLLNGGFVSSASSTVSGLFTADYASTTALTISGSGHSFNITNSSATSTIVGDVNIAGSTGVTIWTNEGNSNVSQGSLNIGSATPQNGFAVTRLGGSDTTFARFTEAGGALAQFVDGTGIQLDFRDTGVISRIRFDTNGDNYITPATGNVYFSPAAGNVGVGTSSPLYPFSVQGASSGFIAGIRNTTAGGDLLTLIGDAGDSVFDFVSGGTGGEAVLRMYSDGSLVNQISARSAETTYFNGGNVGIGTTTPGTLLSLGNTGASTINITPTGTSTFGLGINLRGGCFAINDTCVGGSGSLSGGTAGMLAAWTSSSALTATSSPTALFFTATSTSLASVFPYASTTALTVSGQAHLGGIIIPDQVGGGIALRDAGSASLTPTQNMITWAHPSSSEDTQLGYLDASNFGINVRSGGTRQLNFTNSGTGGLNVLVSEGLLAVGTTTVGAGISASSTTQVGLMVDQRGTDDILRLLDGGTTVLEVPDGGNLYLANNDFLGWRNSSGAVRTIMSHDSSNNVNIKTSDSTVLRFLSSTGVFELARINQSNYASFGIGTTTPGAMLSASSSAGAIGLMVDQQGTGDIARFLDAGSPVLNIIDGGNIGIGTSSPDYLLTIGNTAGAANNRIAIDAAAARQSSIAFRSAGVNRWFIGRGDSDVLSDSSFFIGNTSGGTNNDAGGASAKLTINSSGLVGIGTSTAATTEGLLHVADNSTGAVNAVLSNTNSGTGAFASWQVRNGGSLAEGIRLGVTGTGFTTTGGFIQDGGFLSSGANIAGGLALITQGSAPIRFYTNGHTNERVIVTSGGLLGVGTTTPGAQTSITTSSDIGLMVNQSGTADIARLLDNGSTVFRVADGGEVTLGPGTSNPGIQLQEAGTMRWTIYNDNTNDRFYITDDDTDNGVYIAQDATSWTANSDIRLKENIVPIEGALEKLLNLTGYTYNFKGTKRNEIGLIAQEVLPLFPELVDTNGTYLGLTYDRLGPIIIQAIKEQQLQIEEISDLTSTSTTMWSLDEETGNLTPFGLLNLNNQDLLNVKSITSASGNWSIGEDGTLTAKKIQTEELCVGNVCIDQDDLRDILRSADINFLDHINNDDDNSTTTDDTATSTDDTATTTDETVSSTPLEEPTGDETPTDDGGATPEPEIEEPVVEETPPAEIPTDNGGTEPEPEATPDPVPAE